jgi:hypothetical protein
MKMLRYLPVAALAFAFTSCKENKSAGSGSSAEVAPGAYVLAKEGTALAPGTKFTTTNEMLMKNGVMKVNAGGQTMEGTMESTERETKTVEIISAEQRKIVVTQSESIQKAKMGDQEMPPQDKPNALLNLPVTFTKANGKWTAALSSGEATAEQTQKMEAAATGMDDDTTVYGTEPRKIGDTWKSDASKLGSFNSDGMDMQGEVELTFKGVETYEGKQCARLEGTMNISGKSAPEQGGQDVSIKGTVQILRSLDDLEDLKAEFKGTMEMKGEMPGGDMNMKADMEMNTTTKFN